MKKFAAILICGLLLISFVILIIENTSLKTETNSISYSDSFYNFKNNIAHTTHDMLIRGMFYAAEKHDELKNLYYKMTMEI